MTLRYPTPSGGFLCFPVLQVRRWDPPPFRWGWRNVADALQDAFVAESARDVVNYGLLPGLVELMPTARAPRGGVSLTAPSPLS